MTDLHEAAKQALEALESLYLPGELKRVNASITALKAALEQPDQAEPVAIVEMVVPHLESIIVKHILGSRFPKVGDYLYTHPPRREWRGLTDEEIDAALPHEPGDLDFACARAVEAALKEKNHG